MFQFIIVAMILYPVGDWGPSATLLMRCAGLFDRRSIEKFRPGIPSADCMITVVWPTINV